MSPKQPHLCKGYLWDEQSGPFSRDMIIYGDPTSKLIKSKLQNCKYENRLDDVKELLLIICLGVIMVSWLYCL